MHKRQEAQLADAISASAAADAISAGGAGTDISPRVVTAREQMLQRWEVRPGPSLRHYPTSV